MATRKTSRRRQTSSCRRTRHWRCTLSVRLPCRRPLLRFTAARTTTAALIARDKLVPASPTLAPTPWPLTLPCQCHLGSPNCTAHRRICPRAMEKFCPRTQRSRSRQPTDSQPARRTIAWRRLPDKVQRLSATSGSTISFILKWIFWLQLKI